MRRLSGALVVGLAVVVTIACGSSTKSGDLARGRALFQNGPPGQLACGFCHTLRAAETSGEFASNLDQEGGEYQIKNMSESDIRAFVLGQIHKPQCFGPNDPGRCMPKDLFTGQDAVDVSTFVAKCAGQPGKPGCEPVAGGLSGEAGQGERFFGSLGCVSCHWQSGEEPSLGPTLAGIAGSRVQLADGTTVTVDHDYLIESILLPDEQIVAGYAPGLMSGRVAPGQISIAQANALAAYINALE